MIAAFGTKQRSQHFDGQANIWFSFIICNSTQSTQVSLNCLVSAAYLHCNTHSSDSVPPALPHLTSLPPHQLYYLRYCLGLFNKYSIYKQKFKKQTLERKFRLKGKHKEHTFSRFILGDQHNSERGMGRGVRSGKVLSELMVESGRIG